MNKKGALEISVNAIVILIIALAVLGLIIGFAVSKFRETSEQINTREDTPEATAQQPITLPDGRDTLQLSKAGSNTLAIGVYNSGTGQVDAATTGVVCVPEVAAGTGITFSVPTGTTIDAGKSAEIPVSIEVAGVIETGRKSCTLTVGTSPDTVERTVFVQIE